MNRRTRIDPKKLYTPREIANLGYIKNRKGKPDYWRVLALIKGGMLKAENYSLASKEKGTNPYYVVKGADLVNFLDKQTV